MERGPRPKTATVERREASVPRSWDAPRLTSAEVASRKRDNRTSAPAGAPPTPPGGWTRSQGHHSGAKTRLGNEDGCVVWHREFEVCTPSGVAPQCVQPTPAAGGGLAARVPNAVPSHAYCRRRRLSINARALYFSCCLQCGPLDCTLRVLLQSIWRFALFALGPGSRGVYPRAARSADPGARASALAALVQDTRAAMHQRTRVLYFSCYLQARRAAVCVPAPSLSLQPKSDVSDFGDQCVADLG